MEYHSRYEEFLEKSRRAVPAMDPGCPHIAVGYTSDLDAVLSWDQKVFDRLIAEHLQREPSFCEGETIHTLADLASILAYFIINGLGGEMELSSPDICEWLVSNFAVTNALGGTGAQCSAALGTLGYPAVIHISDRCRPVCKLLDYPSVKTVQGGRLMPVMALAADAMPIYHFICQYDKGTQVTVSGKTLAAPVSNRLILDFDTIHKHFLPDPGYKKYLEAHAREIRVLSISGFNAIVDQKIARREIKPLVDHIRCLKQKNPALIVYLESAHYFSGKVREIIFEMLGPCIDIFGMNEEEVVAHTALEGIQTDKNDFDSIVSGLQQVIRMYGVRGIILHTKDYSAYCGAPLKADIELGLTAGNLLSGTRARVGHYGTFAECQVSLSSGFSQTGSSFMVRAAVWQAAHPETQLVLVPSRYLEHPKYTIGLGDTFVAGVLTCFA